MGSSSCNFQHVRPTKSWEPAYCLDNFTGKSRKFRNKIVENFWYDFENVIFYILVFRSESSSRTRPCEEKKIIKMEQKILK